MRKLFTTLTAGFLCIIFTQVTASSWQETSFNVSAGFRRDSVEWTVGLPRDDMDGDNVVLPIYIGLNNTLYDYENKHKWKDLQIYYLQGMLRTLICDRVYFRAQGGYGTIQHGRFHKRDYFESFPFGSNNPEENPEELQLTAFSGAANNGEVLDGLAGLGYKFTFLGGRFTAAPISGYSHHEQHLTFNSVDADCDFIGGLTGHIPGIHGKYDTRWYGPWVGMDIVFDMQCCWSLYASAEFHWPRYRGKGRFEHLPYELVSHFKQTTIGYGEIFFAGLEYDLCKYWKLGILYNYSKFKTRKHGKEVFIPHDDCSPHFSLHRVMWLSWSIMGDILYTF
jgi:opacity protein-like surface antigen